jgi:uncharacterized membrane protein YeaQ/YmgE (transglycosylase-associated protein family)
MPQPAAIGSRWAAHKVRGLSHASGCIMSLIGWVILGLIAGFVASKIVNKTGEGFFIDIVLGIVGAIIGGSLFSAVGLGGVTGLNLYSMVVSVIGAVVVLVLYHYAAGRRAH